MKRFPFALAICFAALTASHSAQAETIFLKCGPMDMITVDLTNHTVNNLPANITPVAIDWHNGNAYSDVNFHIDRTAGTLRTSGIYHTQNGDIPIPRDADTPCTVGRAPARKF